MLSFLSVAREARAVKRRAFISLLGGAAAAWPLAARAQQPERMRRIGVLMGLRADDLEAKSRLAKLRRELERLGWLEGSNLHMDIRFAPSGDQAAISLDCCNTRKASSASGYSFSRR
jgi:hypothetical protein